MSLFEKKKIVSDCDFVQINFFYLLKRSILFYPICLHACDIVLSSGLVTIIFI